MLGFRGNFGIESRSCRMSGILTLSSVMLLEAVIAYFFLYTDFIRKSVQGITNYNILFYVVYAVSVVLSCIGFHYFWGLWKCTAEPAEGRKREYILEGLVYIAGFMVLGAAFVNTPLTSAAGTHYLPWHESRRTEMLVVIAAVWLTFQVRTFMGKKGREEQHIIGIKAVQALLALLAGWSIYQPNCFLQGNSMYHGDAYFNSVYRVLKMQPYNEIQCGVYGFYGIILAPFTKLLGGDFKACVLILSVLTALCVLGYFNVLNKLVHSSWLKIAASIGLVSTFTSSWSEIYLQLWPHRFIFPGFVLWFIVWKKSGGRKGKKWDFIGLMLLILSLVWNLETGIACVLAYAGSDVVSCLQEHSLASGVAWRKLLLNILTILLSAGGAYLFVGIYNLCVGEPFISVQAFLFPFVNNPYLAYLEMRLPLIPSAWMLFCTLLGIVIYIILRSTCLCGGKGKNDKTAYLTACAAAAAVQFVYYVNRAVYGNLFIVLPTAVIMMAFVVEYLQQKGIFGSSRFGNGIFRGAAVIQAVILLLTAGMGICKYMPIEVERDRNRAMQPVKELAETIAGGVPADTQAIGIGIPAVYSYLGWDTKFYAIDMADLDVAPAECKQYIYEVLENAEDIFIDERVLDSLRNSPQGIREGDQELQVLSENGPVIIDNFLSTHEVRWGCEIAGHMYSYYGKI